MLVCCAPVEPPVDTCCWGALDPFWAVVVVVEVVAVALVVAVADPLESDCIEVSPKPIIAASTLLMVVVVANELPVFESPDSLAADSRLEPAAALSFDSTVDSPASFNKLVLVDCDEAVEPARFERIDSDADDTDASALVGGSADAGSQ